MSDESGFKVGDVVRLKSGGPWMTVSQIHHYGIGCEWFSADVKVNNRVFLAEQLRLFNKEVDEPALAVL